MRTVTPDTPCARCHQIAPPLKHVELEVRGAIVLDELVCIPCLAVCDAQLSAAYPTAKRRWTVHSVDARTIAQRLRRRPGVEVCIEPMDQHE